MILNIFATDITFVKIGVRITALGNNLSLWSRRQHMNRPMMIAKSFSLSQVTFSMQYHHIGSNYLKKIVRQM